MKTHPPPWHGLARLRKALLHVIVTVLAIAIAFSLPSAAQIVLYRWWPRVMADSSLLLATEISLAALLVLCFHAAVNAFGQRALLKRARMAALVHARVRSSWLSRWRERQLLQGMPAARDAYVLSVTGSDAFAGQGGRFHTALQSASEIRVLLAHPASLRAQLRPGSQPDAPGTAVQMLEQIGRSIDTLAALRQRGIKVALKFYDQPPFWNLAILGEQAWVQYCHGGDEIDSLPEYVFAVNHQAPGRGLFMPFYMHFLEMWGQPHNPELDFDRGELVYRDEAGNELRRAPLQLARPAGRAEQLCAVLQPLPT